jgi:hypothetical protein
MWQQEYPFELACWRTLPSGPLALCATSLLFVFSVHFFRECAGHFECQATKTCELLDKLRAKTVDPLTLTVVVWHEALDFIEKRADEGGLGAER